jgi:hypothetical protein
MNPMCSTPSDPLPSPPDPELADHLREKMIGARDTEVHRRLEEKLAALNDRWNRFVHTAGPAPNPDRLREDLIARYGLLKEALCGCQFSGQNWTEQRANALVKAATGDRGGKAADLERLRAWRGEMSSLLRMAVDEGRQGKSTNVDLCHVASLPSPSAHRNLVRAFQDVLDHDFLIEGARHTPGTAGHSHLLAALDLLDSASRDHLQDPDALVRYNEVLRLVRTLEYQAVIEANTVGARSTTLAAVLRWLDLKP